MGIITVEEHAALRARIDAYEVARKALCGKRNYVTLEEMAQLPPGLTNDEVSAVEVFEFLRDKPATFYAYVDEKAFTVTTWTGDKLGTIRRMNTPHMALGYKRRYVYVHAITGERYSGWYACDNGTLMRLKKDKYQ